MPRAITKSDAEGLSRVGTALWKAVAAARIEEGISSGITLTELCTEEGMPSRRAVYDWLNADAEFASRFARARQLGHDAIAEETFAIADDGSNDWIERRRQDGSTEIVLDKEHVQRSKLRVWTRLQLLAKWDPRRYGDKVQHTGADGSGPVQVITSEMSPQEAAAAYQAAIKGG